MILRHVRRSDIGRKFVKAHGVKSAMDMARLAEQETFLVYGVKTYKRVVRCPRCRTKNFKRRKDGVCFHCAATEKGGA